MHQVVTLHADIIWNLFTLIAEDHSVAMDERLDCILKGTLVSREWHHTIVTAPNIWSRLVYVDSNRRRHRNATPELLSMVVKRAGQNTSLCMEATATKNNTSHFGMNRRFLADLMMSQWDRIERISLYLLDINDSSIKDDTMAVIKKPAPRLQACYLMGYGFYERWDVSTEDIISMMDGHDPPLRPLFSNIAPRLREFLWGSAYVPRHAPWLSNLTTLKMSDTLRMGCYFEMDIVELLQVLKPMSRLKCLDLSHLDEYDRTTHIKPMELESICTIDLPLLKSLEITGHALTLKFLLDHIKRSRFGCLVRLEVCLDSEAMQYRNLIRTVVLRTLEEHIDFFRESRPLQHLAIIINRNSFVLSDRYALNHKYHNIYQQSSNMWMGVRGENFSRANHRHDLDFQIALGGLFEAPCLGSITSLFIIDMDTMPASLMALTSVTTLEVCRTTTLHWLMHTGWGDSSSNNYYHDVLPNLKTLRVYVHYKQDLKVHGCSTDKFSEAIIEYTLVRCETGLPIESLEILQVVGDMPAYVERVKEIGEEVVKGLGSAPDVSGLKVTWMESWDEMKEHTFRMTT